MIKEIKTGDYIEKSELDTEQKYNDVVAVFGQWGFTFHKVSNDSYSDFDSDFLLHVNNGWLVMDYQFGDNRWRKRKLTYDQVMQLKKVDVDNCNVDKLVSGHNFRSGPLADAVDNPVFKISNRVSTVNRDLEGQMKDRLTNNKYERMVEDRYGDSCHVDVYDVLKAFEVTCPATQHAIKKLLCTGLRGHKDRDTDLLEAKESVVRAIELNGGVK